MARSKNTKLLANFDCPGGGQVWVEGNILYVGHMRQPTGTTIVDIADNDPIFHTVYDLDDRFQVPGEAHLYRGYKNNGIGAHWRGIFDDKGRVMVAISYNSDLGDAWEWADAPHYPEKFSGLAIRIGVNYVVYAMTH